jgi:hypothetical protein
VESPDRSDRPGGHEEGRTPTPAAPGDRTSVGLPLVDRLVHLGQCALEDYLAGASEYIRESGRLTVGQKKAAQIRLSWALGQALLRRLRERLPLPHATAGEREVSGALRVARADVCELHPLDGLRLAVEIKPVNLAVGRAIWNRFGDIRTFAVNLHLKFPFAVVGGVLAVPTYEEAREAGGGRRSTVRLIERAVARLIRAGGRLTEGDAPHLLEGVGVIVYDPETARLIPDLPPPGSGLRWDEFVAALNAAYEARFE